MAELKHPAGFRESNFYKQADSATRSQLARYQSELKISDEHMAWLLYLQDLRDIPKEEKQKGNHVGEGLVIGAMALFLVATQSGSRGAMLIASLFMIAMAIVYMTGLTNPYSDTLRRVKKKLKKDFPAVPDFKTWQKQQESES